MNSFTSGPLSSMQFHEANWSTELIALAILEPEGQAKTRSQTEENRLFRDQAQDYMLIWCIGTWDVSRYGNQMGDLMSEVVQYLMRLAGGEF